MSPLDVSILLLSDLHLGDGEAQDGAWDVTIKGAAHENRRDRLLDTILALGRRPTL